MNITIIFSGITAYHKLVYHYGDVKMDAVASQITSLIIVYSIVYSDADQRKHQSSASLAFVRGIHRGPVNSPHKWPVTRKMFPFDDVIMWHNNVPGLGSSQMPRFGSSLAYCVINSRCMISTVRCNIFVLYYIDDLVQDCSKSIANALELLQSCSKPSIFI